MRMPVLVQLLLWCVGIYGALCLVVLLFQRRLMYFPDQYGEPEAVSMARQHGLEPWRDGQGRLRGWRRAGAAGVPCVVVFHGNAATALERDYYLPLLGGRELILIEYPGYGPRPGVPSESALVADAVDALAHLEQEGRAPILLLGESLGSGVAVQAAAQVPHAVAGLLLVTPVARMSEVAAKHYPYLPVRLLLRERWDNASAIRTFTGPVAILVAGRDEVVGAEQGRRLAASNARSKVWEQPEAGHNTLDFTPGATPWTEMLAYLQSGGVLPR